MGEKKPAVFDPDFAAHLADGETMAAIARQAIRHLLTPMVAEISDMPVVRDLMLGALAGVVECWVCCCNPEAGKDRIAEALKDVIDDFVAQALEAQRGPIQ